MPEATIYLDNTCPVCRTAGIQASRIDSAVPLQSDGKKLENRTHSDYGLLVPCPRCRKFVVTSCDADNLLSMDLRNGFRDTQLSALLREQTIHGLPPFWLRCGMDPYGALRWEELSPIDLDELLARWPRSVPEQLDRALCNLARLSKRGGEFINVYEQDVPILFGQTPDEAQYIAKALIDQRVVTGETHSGGALLVVSPRGWARFTELTRDERSPENPAFVAMWFGDKSEQERMTGVYRQAIEPALVDAGYLATRVDFVQHNDWIMDRVLGDIRLAPFVVADFTGQRPGVYFEAGFARGLEIPVIHTCDEAHFDDSHFDTKQLNHIVWKTIEELRLQLYHRVVGTIGPGPFPLRGSGDKFPYGSQ